jgi:DNA (cytosine-5)-methyltransferase 1
MTDVFSARKRSEIMAKIHGRDTKPELVVRKALRNLGVKFKSHFRELPGTPDFVFPEKNKLIFIHGCFWHGHRACRRAKLPTSNKVFWKTKIRKNADRDLTAMRKLRRSGWSPHIIWTCELKGEASLTRRLENFLGDTRPQGNSNKRSNVYRNNRKGFKTDRKLSARDGIQTAIDLFAGAGGLSLAAKQCKIEVRAAIENDRHACASYQKNIIDRHTKQPVLLEEDIARITWRKLMRLAGFKKRECGVLLGGPPCQGFSTHRLNGDGVGDPRNDLLLTYLDGIEALRPKAFLVENVPGLLWERHRAHLSLFLKRANALKYRVYGPTVLNARDYGVPQNRRRVFVVGIRSDQAREICWPPAPTHCDPRTGPKERSGRPNWVTARDVFLQPLRKADPNAIHMQHSAEMIEVFRSTPKNGGSRSESMRILPCHKHHNGHKDVYGRMDPLRPGPTITGSCINPSKGRFLHPTRNHGITARHAARFQTFPDGFVFEGGLIAAGYQIGNAVPVRLGRVILRTILQALQK